MLYAPLVELKFHTSESFASLDHDKNMDVTANDARKSPGYESGAKVSLGAVHY